MSLNKFESSFDPAETENDQVGAFLTSSDGTLLTHTTIGGIEALDVNIANAGAITIDGEVSLDAATLAALETTTVIATDLDIRDLLFATDKVDVSGSEVSLDAATLAALESVTVSATDLDIRDLVFATDKVDVSGSTISTTEAGFSGCNNEAKSVTTTVTDLLTTDLANRKSILIQNLGNKSIFIGCDNTVTAANGIKVPSGASAEFRMGAAIDVHAITSTGTADVRIIEFS